MSAPEVGPGAPSGRDDWHAVDGAAPLDEAERRRLAAVEGSGLLGTPPEERFDRITRYARELFDEPLAFLNVVDDASLVVKSPQAPGQPAARYPYGTTFCEYTVHGTGVFEVPDALRDARFAETAAVTEFGVRSYAGVPLRVREGEAIGTLCVLRPEPGAFTDEERARLVDLGRWAEAEIRQGQEPSEGRRPDPSSRPVLHEGGLTATALDRPFGAVSGDLHAWAAGAGTLTATLADVMGKGPVAGRLAEDLRAALYVDPDADPAASVAAASTALDDRLVELGAFVTVFHARVDVRSGDVEYVDAGHGLTVHVHASGAVERLSSHDLPLGLHDAASGWATGTLHLSPGDALVSVSDGVLDAYDSTLASLDQVVVDLRAAGGVDPFLDGLSARIDVARVDDDVTVLVITRD